MLGIAKFAAAANQDSGNKWTIGYWITAVSKWFTYTILGDKDGNLIDSEHPLDVRPSLPTGASTSAKQDALAALVGEVQADPTENTVLERLKVLETELVDIKSTSGVKKITDAVDVSDKAERELGVVTLGGSLPSLSAGTATVGNVGLVGAITPGDSAANPTTLTQVQNFPLVYGGGTWHRPRVNITQKVVTSAALANNAEVTLWTPAAGKKVRMMRLAIYVTKGGVYQFKTGGTFRFSMGFDAARFIQWDLGQGYPFPDADGALTLKNTTGEASDVYVVVSGCEE